MYVRRALEVAGLGRHRIVSALPSLLESSTAPTDSPVRPPRWTRRPGVGNRTTTPVDGRRSAAPPLGPLGGVPRPPPAAHPCGPRQLEIVPLSAALGLEGPPWPQACVRGASVADSPPPLCREVVGRRPAVENQVGRREERVPSSVVLSLGDRLLPVAEVRPARPTLRAGSSGRWRIAFTVRRPSSRQEGSEAQFQGSKCESVLLTLDTKRIPRLLS